MKRPKKLTSQAYHTPLITFATLFVFICVHVSVAANDEPSHIQLCKAILSPQLRNGQGGPVQIVKEKKEICDNPDMPYLSLLQIFASSLLSEVGRMNGINVWYTFEGSKSKTSSLAEENGYFTIQNFLPSPLIITDDITQMGLPLVDNLCTRCVRNYESTGTSSPGCILFGSNDGNHHDHLLLPEQKDENNDLIQRRKLQIEQQPLGLHFILPSIRKNLVKAVHDASISRLLMSHNQGNKISSENQVNTVIYIPHPDETKHYTSNSENFDHLPPYIFYTLEIPRYVTQIEIISHPTCEECHAKGEELRSYLNVKYPRSEVTHAFYPSSIITFVKMMTAYHLICPNAETCLLPAVSRELYSTLALSNISSENNEHRHINPLIASLNIEEYLSTLKIANVNNIEHEITRTGRCRHIRGRFGRWVQDMMLAPKMQYKTPLNHLYGKADSSFQPTEQMPFRRSTTFKWEPTEFPFCGVVELMTVERLCEALESLDIVRLFMVGDSLQQSHAYSLWKLLGHEDDPQLEDSPPLPSFVKDLDCPKSKIQFSYTRNDQMKENNHPVSMPKEIGNCSKYCYPWTDSYRSHPGKTLLIASIGTHFHDKVVFQEAFDEFIRTIDSIRRSDDIVLFRTNVPGHFDCNDKEIPNKKKPFDSFFEYLPTGTNIFSWDQFIHYNEYAERVLYERSYEVRNSKLQNMVKIELLDVYPMTVLRSDGHIGGEECQGSYCQKTNIDCLHYNLPGPIDWWNHLMYNNILDIAREK